MSPSEVDRPDVVARPPLVYLAAMVAGLVLEMAWPSSLFSATPRVVAGLALLVAGSALMALGIREFRKAETHYRTDRPATTVITTGPFRYSRNPLYVSLALAYAGVALLIDSAWVLAMLVPTLFIIRYGVIAREETYLEEKFGESYRRYRDSVRRWV